MLDFMRLNGKKMLADMTEEEMVTRFSAKSRDTCRKVREAIFDRLGESFVEK